MDVIAKALKNIKQYCKDITKIENYEKAVNDSIQKWEVHHRLETHFSDGTPRPLTAQITSVELKALDMYYNRPPEELIFLTRSEHKKLHQSAFVLDRYGKKRSIETREKMAEAKRGKPNVCRGRHWYNNEIISVRTFECPEGFRPGQLRNKK